MAQRLVVWMRLKDPELLRRLIAAKRPPVSQRALAATIGKRHGTLGHLLAGRKTSCSADTAVALAEALGVPVDVLFEARMSVSSGTGAPSVSNASRQASNVVERRAA